MKSECYVISDFTQIKSDFVCQIVCQAVLFGQIDSFWHLYIDM